MEESRGGLTRRGGKGEGGSHSDNTTAPGRLRLAGVSRSKCLGGAANTRGVTGVSGRGKGGGASVRSRDWGDDDISGGALAYRRQRFSTATKSVTVVESAKARTACMSVTQIGAPCSWLSNMPLLPPPNATT